MNFILQGEGLNLKNRGDLMNNEILEAIQELKNIGAVGVHEHCRGIDETDKEDKLAYKSTIKEVIKIANALGFRAICDMPNTIPPIISEEVLLRRLGAARKAKYEFKKLRYYVWVGLTADQKQIVKAVTLWNKYPQVVGLKMFAGKSTGNLAVITEAEQRIVYQTLAKLGYTGHIAVHCEEEKYIKESLYDPKKPWTHALARPEIAETSSVKQQIRLATETGFLGWLHICHVFSHESVNIIDAARSRGAKISCGITPQALLYSVEQMEKFGRMKSLLLKCNPPIRTEANRLLLVKDLKQRRVDLIETDHAPHTIRDKLTESSSGVMGLFLLPKLYIELLKWNFEDRQIKELLRENALKIFTKIKV